MRLLEFTVWLLIVFLLFACDQEKENIDEQAIKNIQAQYVEGWKKMDTSTVMGLLEAGARIQPNRLTPMEGKEEILRFWFPDDDSKTMINEYQTELLNLTLQDTLAFATQTSYLDWSYEKDTFLMNMIQRGLATTIYRKNKDGSWKIWRKMWTDYTADRY